MSALLHTFCEQIIYAYIGHMKKMKQRGQPVLLVFNITHRIAGHKFIVFFNIAC
jgi:tetrahydromethanopterin S-methyltransferase subunit E